MSIKTYQDLIAAKKELKQEITTVETAIKDNKLLRFSSTIIDGKSLKKPIIETLGGLDLKNVLASPLGSLASTFFLSNKYVRKYFVAFTILKETIPYAYGKIKEMLEQQENLKKDINQT
ncbi:hypothetical protein [Urechidicola vernalis]|uniref:Uncharacterized protein n=1 Tax=Urechidicola vernalis TaxID=3075600 RepID=A0ABU2Y6T6_9FLAO|nr:hypothetical protein [Urechidicola sp. P050]MDT0553914.1 hypothetical protein [Urechidicola sp. P050]